MLGLLCEQSLATHLMLWNLPVLTQAPPLLIPVWQMSPAFGMLHSASSSAACIQSQVIVSPPLLPQTQYHAIPGLPGTLDVSSSNN